MMKVISIYCLLAFSRAAPAADPEADPDADPHYVGGRHIPIAYHTGPAPNCVTEEVILITNVCTPKTEEVCSTETLATQEIEYEKICTEIVDNLCDAAPAATYHHVKREAEAEAGADAEAEADPLYITGGHGHHATYAAAPVAHAAPVAPVVHAAPVAPVKIPVAHAVAHSITETVKHACREVTTEHCVDNPNVKDVPIEVENCHLVTKVECKEVENKLPKTTCDAVITKETQHAAVPVAAPIVQHAPVVAQHAPVVAQHAPVVAHAGYHHSK